MGSRWNAKAKRRVELDGKRKPRAFRHLWSGAYRASETINHFKPALSAAPVQRIVHRRMEFSYGVPNMRPHDANDTANCVLVSTMWNGQARTARVRRNDGATKVG